jgi:hypothetical protein
VVYSFDIALWAGLYAAAMGTVQLLPAGIGMARVEENFAQGLAAVFVIGGICCLLRLTAAYQLYLRFPHSFLTVLLSQIVVSLLAMNTVVLLMLAFS